MKFPLLAASAVLMCAAGAPQSADAGGFAISIGGPRGFNYYNGPVYGPAYGYGYQPVAYRGYGYYGGRQYGATPFGYRGFSNRGVIPRSAFRGRNDIFFDRGDRRRLERNVRRVIRRW